jgi:hypothetical protein
MVSKRMLVGAGEVGQFVNIDGRFAIVCVSPQDPQKQLMVAWFDPERKFFTARPYLDEPTLVFAGERTFEPDVASPATMTRPGADSGATAFLDTNGSVCVVVRTMQGSDWRLLAVDSGEIVGQPGSAMHAFPHWRLGVIGVDGRMIPLLQV